MKVKRVIIEGIMAHFGYGMSGKTQKTYEIPNPSTIVGIIENLYDLDKCNSKFNFGYFIEYSGKHEDFMSIKKHTSDRKIKNDNVYYEYLNDVRLVIYTDIEKDLVIREVLRLGCAKCLGTLKEEKTIELKEGNGYTYNQLAKIGEGDGKIRTCNTLTYFDEEKGYFEYEVGQFQECIEIEGTDNLDDDFNVCINMFEYENGIIK